ncbi:Fc.00g104570.m01.CDS01 [Cosmosporella sp. VM-42]
MAECVNSSCKVRCHGRAEKREEYNHELGKARETCNDLRNDLIRIGHQFFDYSSSITEIQENLHDAWDELIHAAKSIPSDSSEHDRLVTLVFELRELGILCREHKDEGPEGSRRSAMQLLGHEYATMPLNENSCQRLWRDLPYLSQDIQTFWIRESMGLQTAERASLATLTAKLYSCGICPEGLASCVLWLFKEALETERPLTAPSPGSSSELEHSPVPLAELLPACLEWLNYGNFKLAKMSADNYLPASIFTENDGFVSFVPGPFELEAGIAQEGLTISRWLSWRKRLGDLYLHGDKQVSKTARQCFELMVGTGLAIGLKIPGEKRYLEQLFDALDKELAARGFKDCVGPEDIEIDPAWANED